MRDTDTHSESAHTRLLDDSCKDVLPMYLYLLRVILALASLLIILQFTSWPSYRAFFLS
jgi:hypothetical protein